MNHKICPFCGKEPQKEEQERMKNIFLLYTCRRCQDPNHKTLYRVLYDHSTLRLLSIAVEIDDYYLVFRHVSTETMMPDYHTTLFKDHLGVLNGDHTMEPISFKKPVFEVNSILQLPLHDISATLTKLDVYCTFS